MRIDARGLIGVLPVLRARDAITSAGPGEAIELVYDSEETVADLEELAARGFWAVEEHGREGDALFSRLRKP